MTCLEHLGGRVDGLLCTRLDPHETGHTYESTSGLPDAAKEE